MGRPHNARPNDRPRRRPTWANRAVFVVALLGLALFVLARVGVTVLPFDQHHVITQFLGVGLMIGALTQWR
jgi:hypothetical protein